MRAGIRVAIVVMVGALASACATGESEDDQEVRAIAQAPASADDDHDDQPVPDRPAGVAEHGGEALTHLGECEGRGATFELARGEVMVGLCCSDTEGCQSQITFAGSMSHLVVEDQALDEVQFSPGANWLILVTSASSEDETALEVVAMEDLEAMAGPVEEDPQVLHMEDLRQAVSWRLPAKEMHSFERLSARAGDEAARHCDEGHHLPTLFELSSGADPYSQWLELTFDGWTDDERLMATSITDDGGRTVITIDLQTQCMERYDAR